MQGLPGEEIGIDDFVSILKWGFTQTVFNGLKVGDQFEYSSEVDDRVLVMRVAEVTYYPDGRPCLSISRMRRLYLRQDRQDNAKA